MGSTVNAVSSAGQGVMGQFTGTGSQSGFLGTGQYHSDPYQADMGAFAPSADEQAYISDLQKQASGKTPSLAEMQMRQGLDQASAQAGALAASQRGLNPAMAARLSAQAQAGMAQQANAQTAQLRAQEHQQNMAALGNEFGSLRQSRQSGQALQSANINSANNTNAQAYEGSAARRANAGQGMGSMLAFAAMSNGGVVEPRKMAYGGIADDPIFQQALASLNAPTPNFATALQKSSPSQMMSGKKSTGGDGSMTMAGGAGDAGGLTEAAPALMVASSGGKVPGKAAVSGDDKANDKVPTLLSPGEIVIPRSVVAKGPDAAKKFVAALLAKKGKSA